MKPIAFGKPISPSLAGLGNEVFPWAKGRILARLTDGTHLYPRPYWHSHRHCDRPRSRADLATSALLSFLPRIPVGLRVGASDFDKSGCSSYEDYARAFLADHGRPSVIVDESGMIGGYRAIFSARQDIIDHFIYVNETRAVRQMMDEYASQEILIGVHLRPSSGFSEAAIEPGKFNTQLPLEWSIECVRELVRQVDRPARVVVAGRYGDEEIQGLEATGVPVTALGGSTISDLAALSRVDFLVPSISSYSLLAIFLGDALYAWPEQHLTWVESYGAVWGHEDAAARQARESVQKIENGRPSEIFRGLPFSTAIPPWVGRSLDARVDARMSPRSLHLYGVTGATPTRS